MSTSESANFLVSGNDIVKAAYRIVYNVSSEYTLSSEELSDGLQSLNMLVKNLMGPPNFVTKGIKTWQKETASLTLAAKIEYSLKSSGGDLDIEIPVEILLANYKETSSDSETSLFRMTHKEYFELSDKTSTGTPTRFQYERRLDEGLFRLDVVPSSSIISNSDTIEISYLTPLEDFDAGSNDPYFPQEWYRPLKWLLAQEMHPEAGKTLPPEVAALAVQSESAASSVNLENSNLFFEPSNPENC